MAYKQNLPEHVRVGGIDVTIWENDGGTRGSFKNVTIQRSYKDKNGKWQKTGSLKVNDIPKAILALQIAYERLVMKE
ncbi:MAG: hypothetical protein QMD21_03725 [Candidatus Thermoplasmatota archaeon]|nr:hypothetical protein [Candidatus Thermoplasmatota archaeon]